MSDDLMAQFLTEAGEQIVVAERSLAVLARKGDDESAFDACFRAFHTLKGSTGLFDLVPMERVLHAAEDLLGGGRRAGTTGLANVGALLETIDLVAGWLDALRQTGRLPDDADRVGAVESRRLKTLAGNSDDGGPGGATLDDTLRIAPEFDGRGGVSIRYVPAPDSYFMGDDPVALMASLPGLQALKVAVREPFGPLEDYDPYACNLVLDALSSAGRAEVEAALRLTADQVEIREIARVAAPERTEGDATARRTLRVDAERVDRLADLADELVIVKNTMAELAGLVEDLPGGQTPGQTLRARQAELERLVNDLHAAVGKVRLLPLGGVFARFPRLVREIARSLGKTVTLEIEGGDIEVDKTIVDGIFEPLLHLLRNAVDHGVESPARRRQAGKPEIAVLRLTASIAGDQVVITVEDDGAGIDPARIRELAVARGLTTREAAEAMDDQAAIAMIFIPGFSSADGVSAVSGRGVGMDVVQDSARQLGGKVSVTSRKGHGSSMRMMLPVTRILTQVMSVICGGERFGLALDNVVETVRIRPDQIIPVRSGKAFRLRDQVIPVVELAGLLGAADTTAAAGVIVIAWVQTELVGFSVDRIADRMTAAVRPMNGLLAGAPGVLGTCLSSDGSVLMVLDLPELVL
ncbi:chemotaxis protein CheA [Xanthobacter sp. KR7-65]|uniref:chemotaxis protein CheA n=1 Tax=Xanthobacter sp. KR7-65 TaxID=3156612 RepID=UPI0032B5EE2E